MPCSRRTAGHHPRYAGQIRIGRQSRQPVLAKNAYHLVSLSGPDLKKEAAALSK